MVQITNEISLHARVTNTNKFAGTLCNQVVLLNWILSYLRAKI